MRFGDGIVVLLWGWSRWAWLLDASDCRYAKGFHQNASVENKYCFFRIGLSYLKDCIIWCYLNFIVCYYDSDYNVDNTNIVNIHVVTAGIICLYHASTTQPSIRQVQNSFGFFRWTWATLLTVPLGRASETWQKFWGKCWSIHLAGNCYTYAMRKTTSIFHGQISSQLCLKNWSVGNLRHPVWGSSTSFVTFVLMLYGLNLESTYCSREW